MSISPPPAPYRGLPDIDYPFHDKAAIVTICGRISFGHQKINFSTVFAGQAVGLKEVHNDPADYERLSPHRSFNFSRRFDPTAAPENSGSGPDT